jgi:hypothetical protein
MCKSAKIIELEKYLFQGSKQNYVNQFLDWQISQSLLNC